MYIYTHISQEISYIQCHHKYEMISINIALHNDDRYVQHHHKCEMISINIALHNDNSVLQAY